MTFFTLYPYKQTKPVCYDKCNLQRLGSNVHLVMCHTKNALVKSNSVATLNPTRAHFFNGFTESYYVLLQEYPSSSTSCHSVYIPYAYSAMTLIRSVNVYTYTLKFLGLDWRQLDSVLEEENYMFLKAYALTDIEPSLTRVLNRTILYFTHTFKIYFGAQHWWERLYIYISQFSYKILPFMTGK
jgi:hypothetical protein